MNIAADFAAVTRRIEQIAGWDPVPRIDDAPRFAHAVAQAMPPSSASSFDALIERSATAWHVEPALIKAVIANESAFDPRATSPTGAQGLMQLEPATAADLGVIDPYDPAQNIWGGTRYLRGLLDRFHQDRRFALAAYNAGPEAVTKYGGVPPYAQTQMYVERVLASYRRYVQK